MCIEISYWDKNAKFYQEVKLTVFKYVYVYVCMYVFIEIVCMCF